MQITNTTKIPTERIRELIRLVRPSGISNFDVMIKNYQYSGARGNAYYAGSSYHYSRRPFVVVSIQKSEAGYPMAWKGGNGYIPHITLSREEDLLYVLAHELRHLWQKAHPKGWRIWGSRGQFSERDADAYAIKKVREYRKQAQLIVPNFSILEVKQ